MNAKPLLAAVAVMLVSLAACSSKSRIARNNEIIMKVEALSDIKIEPPYDQLGRIRDAHQQAKVLLTEYTGEDQAGLMQDVDEMFRLKEGEAQAWASTGNGLREYLAYSSKMLRITAKYHK
jgi:hypothetical protein